MAKMLDMRKEIVVHHGKVWMSADAIVMMLGLDSRHTWYNYDNQRSEGGVTKIKNPNDRRKKLYLGDGVLDVFVQTRAGEISWHGGITYMSRESRYYHDLCQALVEAYRVAGKNDHTTHAVSEIEKLIPLISPAAAPVNDTGDGESTTMRSAAMSTVVDGVSYVYVGEDVASLREGLTQVFGETEKFPVPEDAVRLLDFVQEKCFGYLDESSDECMKHCTLQSVCAEKRNEILASLASEAETEDAARIQTVEVKANMKRLQEKRKRLSGDVMSFMSGD